ncbi:hypothetical protein B0J11DRAFT_512816 [Dendryphion nanum]|uniref:Uncharacterized protein n=1 Tax=Dendryphion nanum TaxID=256645 RepID=A0A9P9CXX4_9PLEO|nr:hypothetical protein B0J11DRAFT_512816 [Dendryphion nanum]
MTPLVKEWADINHGEKPLNTPFVIGLHIMLESSKAFTWSDKSDRPNPVNCRISTLRGAIDIRSAVEEAISIEAAREGCRQEKAAKDSPRRLSYTLDRFTSHTYFDFYHQAPWVAGSHMAAFHGHAQRIGFRLLNKKGILGCTLHLYSFLSKVSGLCLRTTILDELMAIFGKAVFLGDGPQGLPPTKNFANRLYLFLGSRRLSFRNRNARVKAPLDLSQIPDRLTNLCILTHHSIDSHLKDRSFWSKLSPNEVVIRGGRIDRDATITKFFRRHTHAEIIQKTRTIVEAEFEGVHPIARINCFELYKYCLEMWDGVRRLYMFPGGMPSELVGTPLAEELRKPGFSSAYCMFVHSAEMVDMEICHKRGGPIRHSHHSLHLMGDVLSRTWEGKKIEDILWEKF